MKKKKADFGVFSNGIPYGKWGNGPKTMLVFQGGPGNAIPRSMGFTFFAKKFNPFTDDYTVYFATRKTGMPESYTTQLMAKDYADVIREDFGGRVDVVLGLSFGGMIGQHFAAKYGDLADFIILAVAVIVCTLIAWFAVLFTAIYPKSIFDFVVGVLRWTLRVQAYAFILTTDIYPPFSLS